MFSYDIIKYNRLFYYQGSQSSIAFTEDGKGVLRPELSETGNQAPIYGKDALLAYFIEKPSVRISQEWGSDTRKLQEFAATGANLYSAVTGVLSSLASKEASKNVGEAEGFVGKAKVVMDELFKALSGSTERYKPAIAVEWRGVAPIEFIIDIIFIKDREPVYRSDIYPLLNAASFSKTITLGGTIGGLLQGPYGYSGQVLAFIDIDQILKKQQHSLGSLWLKQGDKVILDLYKILVIKNLEIETSSQLYKTDSGDEPGYKWIKVTTTFSTAVPLPIPYYHEDQGETNIANLVGPYR